MKKTLILSFSLVIALLMYSCKDTPKANEPTTTTKAEEVVNINTNEEVKKPRSIKSDKLYTIIPESVKINWTAFKTSERIPVKGSFTASNISEVNSGNSAKEALDGLKFSIPTSSVFSNNSERDEKLKNSFFGKMIDTENITGTISYEFDGLFANISMNSISYKQKLKFETTGDQVNIGGNLDLKNWKTLIAINALNAVCGDQHKGKDGVSKTWDQVKFIASVKLNIENKK